MIGQRFGRLVVIAQAPTLRYTRWRCRCDCGNERVVSRQLLMMGEKGTRSCGCLGKEQRRAARWSQIARARQKPAPEASTCALAEVWRRE